MNQDILSMIKPYDEFIIPRFRSRAQCSIRKYGPIYKAIKQYKTRNNREIHYNFYLKPIRAIEQIKLDFIIK